MSSQSSFEDFCGGILWNSTLSWNTPPSQNPDLTPCFQDSILIWAPCGFLWLFLPLHLYSLCTSLPAASTPINRLHVAKIATTVLLVALSLCDVIKYVVESQQDEKPVLVKLVSPLILSITLVVSLITIIWERRKGRITSGVLFVFYLLLWLANTFKFASLILGLLSKSNDDYFRAGTFFAFYFLNLLMLILLCFAESRPDLEADPKSCPEVKGSFLSQLTFWWINRLILNGYKNDLTEKDVFKLNPRDEVKSTFPDFMEAWNKELKACNWSKTGQPATSPQVKRSSENRQNPNYDTTDERSPLLNVVESTPNVVVKTSGKQKKPSLFRALARIYGWDLVVSHIFKLLSDGLTFAGPLIQSQLIGFIDSKTEAKWHGYLYVLSFFGVAVLQSLLMQQMFHIGMCLAMKIKGVLMSAVYKKALTISNQARKSTTVGEIVNLMSVDTDRIQGVLGYLWIVWSCPLQLIVALYLLYQQIGVAVFAGLGALFLLLPINYAVARIQQRLEVKQMSLKDNRIKLLNEVLNGIKVLKLYAWELSFKEKVDAVRNAEVANLRIYWYLSTVGVMCWSVAPFLVMLTSFATFVLLGNVLDANTAFVSLTLFNILQFPINLLPMLVSFIVTAVVSLGRLGNFLGQPDIETDNVSSTGDSNVRVQIKDGTFAWGTEETDIPALKDINIELEDGSLVAIVGLVGSGKSSMISAVTGEMEKLEGSVVVNGSTAYVAQQAWIQNATLRDNILFGQPFDQVKYDRILQACALTTDLEILTAGDMTEIGEKGINLSGGQKQRVALARAVYQDLDIYLLDDPLSAVDAHVGKHIFDKVIGKNSFLKNKTRILVTHGIHWLPMVDQIIVMDHGLISEMGSYEELVHHNGPFAKFLKTHLLKAEEEEDEDEDEEYEEDPEVADIQRAILERIESVLSDGDDDLSKGHSKLLKRRLSRQMSVKVTSKEEALKEIKKEEKRKAEEKLIQEEQSETGRVKLSVIIAYIKALGFFNTFLIFLMYTAYQTTSVFGNIWLTQWTSDPILSNSSIPVNSSEFTSVRDKYLGVYGGTGIGQAIFVLIYSLILAYASVSASAMLHSDMLFSVMRSPMSFFDTTPIGRILNRFSHDIEAVDNSIPNILIQVAGSGYTVIASLFIISFSTPVFMALLVPITILYYLIQRFFIPASRQLKRLESNTRSPVYAHFSESVSGAASIRAFKRQQEFEQKSDQLVEHNMVYYFANICANRWLNFRLDLLGGLVILGAALFAVIENDSSGGITGSVAGLSVSYALQATQELNWFVRCISEFELNIVSVERISQFIKLKPEAEWTKDSNTALADWPSQGEIEFENYSTQYRPGLDLVVKDINLQIKPQEKIGICGRTGAGKSSLTTAIFRIIESVSGNIIIDNVTISTLGLHDLRSRLTILPQDPVLFSGTLQMNLDPFSAYSDAEIWRSLEKSHLKAFVEGLPAGLAHDCGEGGQNLSVGQRQLLCLSRALLRKTKVLVLDEATAAVDMETDSLIQETIRTEFKDCTILTIAHRLNTIMDSDRILVLDKGQVAEFDTPNSLLANETSIFYKLAKEAGLV